VGPLSDDSINRVIARNCVPVAVNRNSVQDAKTPSGELYRAIHKQRPQNQGLWIVAPDGKVLGGFHDIKDKSNWTGEVREAIDAALTAYGKIPPRDVKPVDPHPFRGRGVKPDGSVALASSVRIMHDGQPLGEGVVDSIVLDAKTWKLFAPTEAKVGTSWNLTEEAIRPFSRCLSPTSDLVTMPRPEDVNRGRLSAAVTRIEKDIATITIRGNLAAIHQHPYEKGKTNAAEARIQGAATYDVKKGTMRELILILDGEYTDYQPYDREKTLFLAGVEWRAEERRQNDK
jgi:hypothetical protein